MHDLGPTRLGAAVRAARRRLGLTQGALAAACGLSRQTVTQVERDSFPDLGVRKVARLLAALGLELRVQPAGIAPLAGTGSGSRLARLFAAAAQQRRARALALSRRALRRLAARGVRARLAGSLAKGSFRADSDVDFLIERRGRLSRPEVVALIESCMAGFPFDAIFSEGTDPALLALMRQEAERGAPAVRPA